MLSADARLFLWINGLAGRIPILDRLMMLLVNDYFVPTALSLALVALWFWGREIPERENNQKAVLCAMIGVGIASAVVKIINLHYFRPRPFTQYEVNLLFYQPSDSSFPSNPAAVGFALATGVWLRNRRAGTLLYCIAALYAFARVYTGVCYPLDVLGGAAIGAVISYIIYWILRLIEPLPTLVIKLVRLIYLA